MTLRLETRKTKKNTLSERGRTSVVTRERLVSSNPTTIRVKSSNHARLSDGPYAFGVDC